MTRSFDAALQAAIQATRAGSFASARSHLEEAMQLRPESPTPYLLLGANCAQTGMNDEAEAAFIACLSRAPDFAIARFQLGLLQLTNGRASSARASWEPLLILPEHHHLRLFVQGFLAILDGDKETAQRYLHAGISANTDNPPLNHDMHQMLARLANLPSADAATAPLPAVTDDAGDAAGTFNAQHYLVSSYGKE